MCVAAATVSPNFQILDPFVNLALPRIVWIQELFLFCLILDYFEVNSLPAFRKIAYVWSCCGLRNLECGLFPFWAAISSRKIFSHASHCFEGHLNNVSEPCFLREPPLWKLNDDYSTGGSWLLRCRVISFDLFILSEVGWSWVRVFGPCEAAVLEVKQVFWTAARP